jgi:hypothetical protein
MSSDTDFLSAKLKFIGKIQPNDKINVKHLYIYPNNFFSKFSRSFIHQDERENALIFVQTTIEKTLEMVTEIINKSPVNKDKSSSTGSMETRMVNVVCDLKNAMIGIKNLSITYSDDKYFCCKIEVIIQEIIVMIKSLVSKFPFLSE